MKTVAVIPIKMNNERTPGKNTKALSDGTPLIHLIQKTLLKCAVIDEIYVYCSRDEIREYLLPGVKYLKRSVEFDTPSADYIAMMKAFANDVAADVYTVTHATAPFILAESICSAVNAIQSGRFDSAFSVEKLQAFLWNNEAPLNYSLKKIPRTQDMMPIWKETCGIYAYNAHVINNLNQRIGDNPYMVEVSGIEAIDIDTPEDFMIADAVYSHMIKQNV